MFQDFTTSADPAQGALRVARLRQRLATLGIDAVFVPRSDEHMGEYVPPSAERLKWLTGFSGSAGLAVITANAAAMFVDGRYVLQAATQVDRDIFEIVEIPQNEPQTWVASKLRSGAIAGFDPWLHTSAWASHTKAALEKKGIRLKPLSRNPVDVVWGRTRPASPLAPVTVHPQKFAGKSAEEKIADLQRTLASAGEDAALLTLPDSIAWLLNIRGADIRHTPTALAFAILHVRAKPELFIDRRKVAGDARKHLSAIARLHAPGELKARIDALKKAGKRVRLDSTTAAHWFRLRLGSSKHAVSEAPDPCLLPKARKNNAEIEGARAAHERDGIAMARYLA